MLDCEQDKVSLRAGNASYFFSVTLHSFTLILLLTPANSKIICGCCFFVCFFLQGILQALEFLLRRNYRPRRSFYVGIGHDEEVFSFLSSK